MYYLDDISPSADAGGVVRADLPELPDHEPSALSQVKAAEQRSRRLKVDQPPAVL